MKLNREPRGERPSDRERKGPFRSNPGRQSASGENRPGGREGVPPAEQHLVPRDQPLPGGNRLAPGPSGRVHPEVTTYTGPAGAAAFPRGGELINFSGNQVAHGDTAAVEPAGGPTQQQQIREPGYLGHPRASTPQTPVGRAEIAVRRAVRGAVTPIAAVTSGAAESIRDRGIRKEVPDHPADALHRNNTIATANVRDSLPHIQPATFANIGLPVASAGAGMELASSQLEAGVVGGLEIGFVLGAHILAPRFAEDHPLLMRTLGASGALQEILEFGPQDKILEPRIAGGVALVGGAVSLTKAAVDWRRERRIGKMSVAAHEDVDRVATHHHLLGDPSDHTAGHLHEQRLIAGESFLQARDRYLVTRQPYDQNGYDGQSWRQRGQTYREIRKAHRAYRAAENRWRAVNHEIEVRSQGNRPH